MSEIFIPKIICLVLEDIDRFVIFKKEYSMNH